MTQNDWTTIEAALKVLLDQPGHFDAAVFSLAAIARLKAEHEDAVGMNQRGERCIGKLRELAHQRGWNGVENSKILEEFLGHEFEEQDATIQRLTAPVVECPPVIQSVPKYYGQHTRGCDCSGCSDSDEPPPNPRVAQLEERVRVLEEALRAAKLAIDEWHTQPLKEYYAAVALVDAALSASSPALSPLEAAVVRWRKARNTANTFLNESNNPVPWSAAIDALVEAEAELLRFCAEIAARERV